MFPLEDAARWEEMRDEVARTCELIARLGGRYLILIDDVYTDLFTGELQAPADLDDRLWAQLVKTSNEIGGVATEHGLQVVFHPHAETHVEYESQIERFLADTDPADVNLCLDTGHVAYYGGDNVELIRRYPDRIGYLHLKQADPAVIEQVKAEGLSFAEAVRRGAMCEPPRGEPDMEALLDAVDQYLDGELFAIVEQDLYPCDPDDPLPIAARTCKYLRQLGVGSEGSDAR